MNDPIATPRRRRPWKRYVLLALIAFAFLAWHRLWQGGVNLGAASANLNKIESSDNFSHSMSSSSSTGARLAASRIVISASSQHDLLARVIPLVQAELVKLPFAPDVKVVPHDAVICDGERLPDVLITLNLPKIDESSGPLQRTLTATVNLRMSSDSAGSPNTYHDSLSPPNLTFDLDGTLDHRSTSLGDGVGSERYRLTAPHIAKEVAKVLTTQLVKLNQEHGQLPPLPATFYGTFRPAPDLVALKQTQAQPILRGSGFFKHHDAVWEFADPRDPKAVFDEIEQAMSPGGWKNSDSRREANPSYLRMTLGSKVLNIFPRRARYGSEIDPPTTSAGKTYVIHYTDRFSSDERDAALTSFADSADVELLLSFRGVLPSEVHAKLITRLQSHPSANAQLFLAEHYEKSDPEKAKFHLRRAFVLMSVMEKDADVRNRVEALAKKLKMEKLTDRKLDVQMLRDMKVPQLQSKELEQIVGLDEPLVVFLIARDQRAFLASVCITRGGDSKESPFQVVEIITSGGSKSSSKSGGRLDPAGRLIAEGGTGYDSTRFRWKAQGLPDNKFKITLTPEP